MLFEILYYKLLSVLYNLVLFDNLKLKIGVYAINRFPIVESEDDNI